MKRTLKKEVMEWANEIRVNPKEIQVCHLKNKWGCCTDGKLIFSHELLNKSKDFRASVIVHELLHLRYKSHNKIFFMLWQAYLNKKGIKLNPCLVRNYKNKLKRKT